MTSTHNNMLSRGTGSREHTGAHGWNTTARGLVAVVSTAAVLFTAAACGDDLNLKKVRPSPTTIGGSLDGTAGISDDEVIDAVLEHVSNLRATDNIDKDCVRDYVNDHSHWPNFNQLADDAKLGAIATALALAVNERC